MSTLSIRLAHRGQRQRRRIALTLVALAVALAFSLLTPGLADICAQDGVLVCGP